MCWALDSHQHSESRVGVVELKSMTVWGIATREYPRVIIYIYLYLYLYIYIYIYIFLCIHNIYIYMYMCILIGGPSLLLGPILFSGTTVFQRKLAVVHMFATFA